MPLAGGAIRLGQWQTGLSDRRAAGVLGVAWVLLMAWLITACLDPRTGWQLLGRDVPGQKAYRHAVDVQMVLGELPADMQERRQFLISGTPQAEATAARLMADDGGSPDALKILLKTDDLTLGGFRPAVQRYIAGLPWYYTFAMESSDGQERTAMLAGCLLLAVVLMIRWPGMGFLAAGGITGPIAFALRVGVAAGVVIAAFAGGSSWAERFGGGAAVLLVLSMAIVMLYWLTWKASQYWRLPRQYSPFLAMRLLQRKRIALFSVGAVMLCVAMVLIVVSVMGGFLDMVRDRSHRLLGDLVMEGGGLNGFPYYQEFIDKIKQRPEVEAATPVIYSYSLLRFKSGETRPVQLVGLRLDEADKVNGFKSNLFYDDWYPGTTTLKEQPQYVYGINSQRKPMLPEPLEKALVQSKTWQALQKDPDKAARYERDSKRLVPVFPGPGVYDINPKESNEPAGLAVDVAAGGGAAAAAGDHPRKRHHRGPAGLGGILPAPRSAARRADHAVADADRSQDRRRTQPDGDAQQGIPLHG